ncbi:putative membrane protein [Neolewinella xylanilytica]|uniref:Putative membrane protein n=1 Tax=Neolewinella xylanilytica TaxID=1514080 RepID=A0A2S6I168_9BACT|nr:bestrophin family ion channel [Neolewinella xylanilytica]PPK84718.1 putative membrane protein [Neolewinella xylanilytica]
MIVYKSNGSWFGHVGHLTTSYTMKRILIATMVMGAYAMLTVGSIKYFDLHRYLQVDSTIFSLLAVILSIFLGFRTTTAYDRWWEGRKQWGALVNNCRNLALYVDSVWPPSDHEIRRFMAKHIANFCLALSEHLRDGTKLDKLVYLAEEEIAYYETKDHVPNFIALRIYQRIAEAHRNGDINEGDYINIKPQHQSLLDILGACERIKKTPIAFSYAVYLKVLVTAYAALLPFGLSEQFGWGAIPLSMLIVFALIGVELMGEEIEDPFGLDCNDLPTGDIAHTIKRNVFEILEDRSPAKEHQKELYEKVF